MLLNMTQNKIRSQNTWSNTTKMSNNIIERNAIIGKATLTNRDHGCLTVWLMLDYSENHTQGFGGYKLYSHFFGNSPDAAGKFIWRIFEIADVDDWDDLVGKTIRVRIKDDLIHSIGHIIKDKWFTPSEELKGGEENVNT